ncbi:branched-chain-amino-acid aminotransferase, cytosolic-like [Lytechinus variegatus]|uniref:branched-chain-amino-acid aminotransferase, cytosolic-like n=1 Tax=Lytechinus variegatus TaxID=7654 RepID=UPI001BB21912|nr:branched-chain-amino-acid aminotransferase, cytosolic-like [Lytechinus variegatus]
MAFSSMIKYIGKSGRQILHLTPGKTAVPVCSVRCIHSNHDSFKYSEVQLEHAKVLKPKPDPNNLLFGHNMSDHMLTVPWTERDGWSTPRITPLKNLSLHPACSVFHYAICLFEGMKAYKGEDGKIRFFRPYENMERMNNSAERAALPRFSGEEMIRCMARLVHTDRDWVPDSRTSSLYMRPTFIGTEPTLGVNYPKHALLYCIVGPVGPYFETGTFNPVTLYADTMHIRAWHGGVGYAKMGSNYAPTIKPQHDAEAKGCQQILWLYGDEHYLTEVGTMNIFLYWYNDAGEKELITPPLDGTILPGVTRRSLLDLAREWNEFKVTERRVAMDEFQKALSEKRIIEFFGAGTACVVCPIGKILFKGDMMDIPTMDNGAELCKRFYNTLMDIQYGRVSHPWAVEIDELIDLELSDEETISSSAN